MDTALNAQLCQGSLGDPVVKITFGAGANPGPPLGAATTNYQYFSADCPNDGLYTVRNSTSNCFGNSWQNLTHDHTGDPNGYFMLVNASLQPNDFYVNTVSGLCPGTTFEFAAWITNVLLPSACNANGIKPNITFSIETVDGTKLATSNSGDIPSSLSPVWKQYGFFFTTPPGISDVVIRMTNNAPGGCGNDLALDDITFRPCGPLITPFIINLNTDTAIIKCEADTTALMLGATISGGYTSPQYQWQLSTNNGVTWADIPGAVNTTYKRLPTPIGRYQYRLTVAQQGNIGLSSCRVASSALTITVNATPVATAVNNGPKWAGSSITLTASGAATYAWTGPGNFNAKGTSVTVPNPVNNGTYYVTATSSDGCTTLDSTRLTVFTNPIATFTSPSPACENSNLIFTGQTTVAAGQSISQLSWDFGDGVTATGATATHKFGQAGSYKVSFAVKTDKNCTDTLVQQVAIHNLPQPAFIMPKVCLTDPFASFTDASTIADGTTNSFAYLWNFGDATAAPGNPNSSTLKNPKHSYTATGVYNVQLTVTSGNGCIKDTTELFTVNGAQPTAAFTLPSGNSLCSNNSLVLTNTSTVNFGSITKIEVYWDYNNNILNKLTDDTVTTGEQYTTQYPVFDAPAVKAYSVHYIAYSGISCISELDTIISVNASPIIVFDTIGPVCAGIPAFTISKAREENNLSGAGIYSGDAINADGLFTPSAAGAGQHTVRYTYTATNGCSSFAEQPVLVYAQPGADAGPDRQLLQGGSLKINAVATGNNPTFLWTPNTNIVDNKVLTPVVSPPVDITYTIAVTSADGCISKDSMFIKVLKTPVIPNAFSPNGDGINDQWVIQYLDSYPGVKVEVFNRYGQQVYNSTGYNTPWDGTYNGKPLPVGTYYYIINRNVEGAGKLSGWVVLLR